MSTQAVEQVAPFLVSELPPVGAVAPGWLVRRVASVRALTAKRQLERALREAGPGEYGDLLALSRRA